MRKGRWIEFRRMQAARTCIWMVVNRDQQYLAIGYVKWFGRWRKYCFFPSPDCVFEQGCLRDIADFCEDETRQHYAELKERKRSAA